MNRVIRRGVFETSSSSSHALSVTPGGDPALFDVSGRRDNGTGLDVLTMLTTSWESAVRRAQQWVDAQDFQIHLPTGDKDWSKLDVNIYEYRGPGDDVVISITRRPVYDPDDLLCGTE